MYLTMVATCMKISSNSKPWQILESPIELLEKARCWRPTPDLVTQNLWDEAWVCLFICPYIFFFLFKASQEVFPHLHP